MKKLIRNRQPVKVLVIEEDPSSLEIIKTLLNQNDFELLAIAPAIGEIDLLLETFQPNIILVALELNSLGIFDFIATPQYLSTPLIGMSHSLDDEMFDRCLEHGKCLLLGKPINRYAFLSSINLLLRIYPPVQHKYVEVIDKNQQVLKIHLADIVYVEAEGNYTFIHTIQNKVYARKKPLKNLKEELDEKFIQINKSHLINIDFIQRLELGKRLLVLNNKEIKIGRSFRSDLDTFICPLS
ncbi:LytR/AlgR family response regulator transcription factor [Flectobacillus roseus]|uniref:LytR/AlgR family response regulator transcription factor n=1 Tax=Flectobacillus roseus TaxID=502259 RepID=UPI0024B7E80B|nr:LytTR family DNA-binding domain-containing protein [Flectobacillus roseus]MDI9869051.1 LytTR family transcriptional regulator DNA-binding domain-containing protein [Flectobacillus roseus]